MRSFTGRVFLETLNEKQARFFFSSFLPKQTMYSFFDKKRKLFFSPRGTLAVVDQRAAVALSSVAGHQRRHHVVLVQRDERLPGRTLGVPSR